MEVNIKDEVVLQALLKNYCTKEDIERMLDEFKCKLLEEIKNSARISFDMNACPDTAASTPAKKKRGPKKQTTEETVSTHSNIQITPLTEEELAELRGNSGYNQEPQYQAPQAPVAPQQQRPKYDFIDLTGNRIQAL